ncbi:hypothetical protein TNCT_298221 [Trichonephila clavata]|uniref:Uncharacterized protein n=1 Tax=Trichonephila clavata TaxID=2740835 RepID=A0A8X6FDI1_TRICU|nr:hypothetical protein TNCT_298221 [Trichonephila clavata]
MHKPGIGGSRKNNPVGPRPPNNSSAELFFQFPRVGPVCNNFDQHVRIPGAINGSIKKDRTPDTRPGFATQNCDAWLIQLRSHNDALVFLCPVHRVKSVDLTRQFKTEFIGPYDFRKQC